MPAKASISVSTLADQVGGAAPAPALRADPRSRAGRRARAWRRHHRAGARQGQDHHGAGWVYVRDDRPVGGQDPPAAVFHYSRDRAGDHPEHHLSGYAGILQADAYAGFNRLYAAQRRPGPLIEAACWSHARRKFFVLADVAAKARGKLPVVAPLALEAVKRMDAIFAIEREINGLTAGKRLAVREERSAPLVRDLEDWLRVERSPLTPCRCGEGDGLHAQALEALHALPRRRPHLPHQQRRRTGARLRSAARPGCSPAPIAVVSAPPSCTR